MATTKPKKKKAKKSEWSPYCKHCGGCGLVGCDGIQKFLEVHVKGKTNCKNEGSFIADIIAIVDDNNDLTS